MSRHFLHLLFVATFTTCVLCFSYAFPSRQSKWKTDDIWRGHKNAVTDLAFSPDGEYVVSSSLDGTVRVWDAASGETVRVLRGHEDEVYAVEISQNGRWIVSTGYDRQVIVSEISGKIAHRLSGLIGWSADIAISPNSQLVAAWSMDGQICIWNLESGHSIAKLEGTKWKWGMALCWSPDAQYLACGRIEIAIWDVQSKKKVKNLKGHRNFVRALSFSPDGRLLASAALDKTARVWDIESTEALYVIEPEGFTQYTRSGPVTNPVCVPVTAVDFSPDGSKLVTAGADRNISLWDVTTGELIQILQGNTMTVTSVSFAPDGKRIASSSLDRTIRLWRLE
jgi:WD40 repeat protein